MNKTILSLILSSMLVLPSMSLARGGGKGGMKKILKELNLTDEQKEKLKAARQKNKEGKSEDRKKIKELWEQMKTKFASNASESELRSLHNEIHALKVKKAEKRFNRLMNIRNILTLEQRKKFQELREKNHKSRRGRSGDE